MMRPESPLNSNFIKAESNIWSGLRKRQLEFDVYRQKRTISTCTFTRS